MRTAEQWLKDELNIEMPEGNISGDWFVKNNLPMVVRCVCCDSTMTLPSAMLNDEGEIFCTSCAGD